MSVQAMQKIAKSVKKLLPKDLGFVILVFPFNEPGVSNYISNANRSDMIKGMREAADRLEKKEDFETPENNMY